MGWLDGTAAIITGGGSGLGLALVHRFVAEGANVGVLERSAEKADKLRAEFGDAVVVVAGDVTRYRDNVEVVARTVERFGRLDTFVGNAAIWDFSTRLVDMPEDSLDELFDEVFHINVKGYLLGARAAIGELAKTGGSVIFTASNAAFYAGGGGPLYTASKHAVRGLITQLAFEFAPKVRVNGVAPGGMLTDLRGPGTLGLDGTSIASLPVAAMVETCTPLAKLAEPADYTGPYVLLASAANSSAATGAVINCDGGLGVRGIGAIAGGTDL